MPKKWKLFERLVAAIHHAESRSAKVKWNDKIDGRQFDVTLRFKYGLYDYLTVIECKDYTRPVSVEKVEAFVTKSNSCKANKAIMVSSSGYQEGCTEVARKHNIELYTLKETNSIPTEVLSGRLSPALNIYNVQLHEKDSKSTITLPEEKNRLPYLMRNVRLQHKGKELSLEQLINLHYRQILKSVDETERNYEISFEKDTKTFIPILEREVNVSSISFNYKIIPAKIVTGPTLDPFLLQKEGLEYEYRDVVAGKSKSFPLKDLKLGFDTILEAGKFYYNPRIESYYYCDKIEGRIATIYLVESYQHGFRIGVVFQQDIKYAGQYVEVTNSIEIKRLKKLLSGMKSC